MTDAATETRVSCSGLKPRVQTEKQAGYEGDASLELRVGRSGGLHGEHVGGDALRALRIRAV